MKPTLSSILSIIVILFIINSIWNLFGIFNVPNCVKGETCYKSYLNTKPELDLLVYTTDNSRSGNVQQILLLEKFDYNNKFERDIPLQLSKTVRNNGSLFIHTIIIPSKIRKDNTILNELVQEKDVTYLKYSLTKYAIPAAESFNLLRDESKKASVKPVTHIRSKIGINMCVDKFNISQSSMPVELAHHLRITTRNRFLPIATYDIMGLRLRDLIEITPTTEQTKISFTYSPISVGKMKLLIQIGASLNQFIQLGFTEKDLDEVKGAFVDTNLYLLCATVFIGSIHLLLDFLSFKNDVSFWKSQKSMAGLSSSNVLWRAFSQTVIFLYLMEEGTALIVLIPCGIGTLIEFWKVLKVFKRKFIWDGGFRFKRSSVESAEEVETRQYEEECLKYLSYLLYPLCIIAAIYSLLYQPHKSWYSWTINSLVNGVYAFGFLFLLPQLFINYRLKSVAALPWRTFTYRAFNTFIDDIFAFIITMPMAHRVACFRDDVVFLIYLYQRWLYPVDKSRVDDITGEAAAIEKKKNE